MQGSRGLALPLAILLVAATSQAGDGRVEISHASILAAGGYPLVIAQPGSYVLTSDLVVPAATDAIVLNASDVTLDLSGFSIKGPAVCAISCPTGPGSGIEAIPPGFGHRSVVRNGTVRGFADDCVSLASSAEVAHLLAVECGGNGIVVSNGSLVHHNRVSQTGEHGIQMLGSGAAFADNVISQSGLGPGSFVAVSGGRAMGGNACDDGSCSVVPRRRFYLTTPVFDGANADNAGNCAQGFHFASLLELRELATLDYEHALGQNPSTHDVGGGPPVGLVGWVRTGRPHGSIDPDPLLVNCSLWSTPVPQIFGTAASLAPTWFDAASDISPWVGTAPSCGQSRPIWCVED